MPLIGLTNCRKIEDYRQSVLHVGGEVRVLDPSTDIPASLEGLDGLLLTGGGDVALQVRRDAASRRLTARTGPRRLRARTRGSGTPARAPHPCDLPRASRC